MAIMEFKTSINCGGCIAAVKPHLEKIAGIEHWSVDTDNPDKILKVRGDEAKAAEVVQSVQRAGFSITRI